MRKQLLFVLTILIAVLFSSCNKDLTALDPSLFTATPNPMVEKAGKVDVTITGTFPVKYFSRNATVTVTPVLVYNGTETKSAASVFQGERVKSNNKVINFKAGGRYSIQATFNYVPEMAKSELYLDFSVSTSRKTYALPRVKVADGVMATAQLVQKTSIENGPVIIPDKFQRVIQEMQEADIKFLIQQANLQTKETRAEDILALTQKIKAVKETPNQQVANFEIAGYASPDGSIEINTNLAERRQKVTSDFINKELKKLKTSVTIDSKFTAEDWAGFQKLMEGSSIQDKQLILSVLSMYTDPEQREREIKNLSNVFKQIADQILPELRRSRLKLTVDVTGKSDAEIAKLAKEDASKLSLEELLYAATLTTDLNEKAEIYTKATEKSPKCLRTFNNLGVIKYQQGKIDEAAVLFGKALALKSTPDVNYNVGISALAKNDISKAEVSFGNAAGTSGNLSNALGTIAIIKGDYVKAKTFFGKTNTNNAAIAQILDGNYNGARSTLDAITQPDALTSYLGAIIGARTNNRDAVYAGLRKAVSMNDTYKAKAQNDIEFAKFNNEDAFKAIVK